MRGWFLLVAAVCLLSIGCASDRRLIANAATSHLYNEARYDRECVQVAGSESCMRLRAALNGLRWEAQTADMAMSKGKGKLPKIARERVKAAKKAVEAIQ